jgi:hypothetical protein
MKFVGKIMFFNKGFMTDYITTIGKTVYFPSKAKFEADPGAYFYTLAHEYVHVADYAARPTTFIIGYLFPQILASLSLLSLLAFFSPYFLLFLLTLIFVAPIPAPYRAWAEIRGYAMSCKVRLWDGWSEETVRNRLELKYANAFTTSAYYFMWPFKNYVIRKLTEKVSSDSCLSDSNPACVDVYNIIKYDENL